jgi:phytoene dehydrogenase-like protein
MSEPKKYYKGSGDGKPPRSNDPLRGARGRYDLIVIGSGLAGLTAANVLARAGHSVLLVEQHYNFGGMATWFKRRGGHVFDVSLHGFPVGMKKTCRKYWNARIADSIVRLDEVRFDNPQFAFSTSFTQEDFTRKLVDVLGVPPPSVAAFFDEIRRMDFFDDAGQTTGALFERHFPGRNDVHRLLMEPISYANGSTLDDPAITYGIVFSNFMSQGVYTFAGGTDRLISAMKAELRHNGVDLYNNVQVERIVVRAGRVAGIEAHGRFIAADAVVSNANVKTTIERLVGCEHFSPQFVAEARAVRLNTSSTQVYLGIRDGETIPFTGDLLFTSTRPTFDSPALCDMHGESARSASTTRRRGRARSSTRSSPRRTLTGRTGPSSTSAATPRRRRASSRTRSRPLDRHVPGTRAKLDHVEAATPRTFHFYTQAPERDVVRDEVRRPRVQPRPPEGDRGPVSTPDRWASSCRAGSGRRTTA